MIRTQGQQQLTLSEFDWPFQVALDETNRWVKMSQCIPWDDLAEGYYQGLSKSQYKSPAASHRIQTMNPLHLLSVRHRKKNRHTRVS